MMWREGRAGCEGYEVFAAASSEVRVGCVALRCVAKAGVVLFCKIVDADGAGQGRLKMRPDGG